MLKEGGLYKPHIGRGTKDGGQSFTMTFEVNKAWPVDSKGHLISLSTAAGGPDGLPAVIEVGTIGAAIFAFYKAVGYFAPAFYTEAGIAFPGVLLPGAQGLTARAVMVQRSLDALFRQDVSSHAGAGNRLQESKGGLKDGQGVLLKGWTFIGEQADGTLRGTKGCKDSYRPS